MRRRARARMEADRHQPRAVAARDVQHVVAVEHADIDGLAGSHRQPLDERLHQPRQPRCAEVALAQAQHARREPELLAVGRGIAEVTQAEQVAPRRGARNAGARSHLGRGHARVFLVECLDHGEPAAESDDQILRIDRKVARLGGGRLRVIHQFDR